MVQQVSDLISRAQRLIVCIFVVSTGWSFVNGQTSPNQQPNIHIVREGQTLYRIAREYGTNVSTLQKYNRLDNTDIFTGQRLIVGYALHTSLSGESDLSGEDIFDSEADVELETGYWMEDEQRTNDMLDHPNTYNNPQGEANLQGKNEEPIIITHIRTLEREKPEATLYQLSMGERQLLHAPVANSNIKVADELDMLAEELHKQEGRTYDKVEILPFDDIETSLSQIRQGIEDLKHKTRSEDLLMINVLSKGQENKAPISTPLQSQNDFRSTVEVQTWEVFFHSIDDIACKKLLICDMGLTHSEVKDYLSSQHLANQEVVVFSAYWYQEAYRDSGQWHHGAIFKAFREGLAGKADMDRDGSITLTEIDMYLNDRVMEITGNVQYAGLIANYLDKKDEILAYLY